MCRLLDIDIKEFELLYRKHIRRDFPRNERRPLFLIRSLYAKGNYKCITLVEHGKTMAYASFIYDREPNSVLLDYFAVDKKLRGQGVGSRFLTALQQYWSDKDGIIIECEKPDAVKSKDEKNIRERRIRFYTCKGAEITPIIWRVFGMDYSVLWMPIQRPSSEQSVVSECLIKFYTFSLPNFIKRRITDSVQKRQAAQRGD